MIYSLQFAFHRDGVSPSDKNGGAGACVGDVVGFVVVVAGGSVDVVVGGAVVAVVGGAVVAVVGGSVVGGRVMVEVVVVVTVVEVVVEVIVVVVVVVVVVPVVADVVVVVIGVVETGRALPQAVRSTATVANAAIPAHSRLPRKEQEVYCAIRKSSFVVLVGYGNSIAHSCGFDKICARDILESGDSL